MKIQAYNRRLSVTLEEIDKDGIEEMDSLAGRSLGEFPLSKLVDACFSFMFRTKRSNVSLIADNGVEVFSIQLGSGYYLSGKEE